MRFPRFPVPLMSLALLSLVAPTASTPLGAQAPGARNETSGYFVGGLVNNGFSLYSGNVAITTSGELAGAQYEERVDVGGGFQAGIHFVAGTAGPMGLTLYTVSTISRGTYQGLGPGEIKDRDILMIGGDLGWRPGWGNEKGALRFPLGPSATWSRLSLTQGHRNKYGDPLGFTTPEVDWEDRTWLSLGGHGGVSVDWYLGDSVSLEGSWIGRFYVLGKSAWEGSEERAIQASTGRVVRVNYDSPLVLSSAFQVGIKYLR